VPITASKGSPYARVEGLGAAVPSRVVDNAEMCTYIDSSDEWIQQRTGIVERRWVAEGEMFVPCPWRRPPRPSNVPA
jgi:3-oxoacyl-[acyl-carrier-protein] synthase-3